MEKVEVMASEVKPGQTFWDGLDRYEMTSRMMDTERLAYCKSFGDMAIGFKSDAVVQVEA